MVTLCGLLRKLRKNLTKLLPNIAKRRKIKVNDHTKARLVIVVTLIVLGSMFHYGLMIRRLNQLEKQNSQLLNDCAEYEQKLNYYEKSILGIYERNNETPTYMSYMIFTYDFVFHSPVIDLSRIDTITIAPFDIFDYATSTGRGVYP